MDDKIKERLQQEVMALAGKVTELTAQLKRVSPATVLGMPDLAKMRQAFRTTRAFGGGTDPREYVMVFKFPTLEAMDAADDEWRTFFDTVAAHLPAAPAPTEQAVELPLPRAIGVSRDAESPGGKGVLVAFERALMDDELRRLHAALAARQAPDSRNVWTDEQREQFRRDQKTGPHCMVCLAILGGQHFPGCSKEGT